MAIGRPLSLTSNIASKQVSATATAGQTLFTVTGGYKVNQLGVYRNGVRLVEGSDFTARDGASVTLLSPASLDDTLDFQIFDTFQASDAVLLSTGGQTLSGNLTAPTFTATSGFVGDGSGLTGVASTDNIITGTAATFNNVVRVGTAITLDATSGIITATAFYGDGANLSNIVSGVELKADGNSVGTGITQINFTGFGSVTGPVAGFSTVSVDRFLTIGVRAGSAVTFSIADETFNVVARSGNVAINL